MDAARPASGRLERMVDEWLMGREGEAHQPLINHSDAEPNRCPA